MAFLIDRSQKFTREVCFTLTEGRGYTADEIRGAASGIHGMQGCNCTTHIDQILHVMGVKLRFSYHYGDFDPNRNGDPFSSAGQFAGADISQVCRVDLIRKGMPLRYTFWFSKQDYSRKAKFIIATHEKLEKINLRKPGLYPSIEK